MNSYRFSRPASALLLTLLVMGVATGLIITVSKSVSSAIRQNALAGVSQEAREMAQAAIEEGLLRLKTDPTTGLAMGLNNSEYGSAGPTNYTSDPNSGYSLTAMRRGFTDTNCTTWGSSFAAGGSGSYQPDCPYYDLTIRSMVSINFGDQNHPNFSYDAAALPQGKTVSVLIKKNPGITLQPSFVNALNGRLAVQACISGTCAPIAGSPFGNGGIANIPSNPPVTSLKLTVSGSDLSPSGVQLGGITTLGTVVIQRGAYIIEATGYAGGVRQKEVVWVYPQSATPLIQQDFARSFDAQGILR